MYRGQALDSPLSDIVRLKCRVIMDWAVSAARKKSQRLPGSTRSIVESLNAFREVAGEGQAQIDAVVGDTNRWLAQVMSPERTTELPLPEERAETPVRVVPSTTTPKSLAKPTWSPYKVEKTLTSEQIRSQRRSNMFVPLPSRDPLVLQPSKPTSSVFERLSSLPTKSFENKVNRKVSSIDVTGSPMRRNSPRRDVESSMQDTLKNIFSTKKKAAPRIERSTAQKANLKPPQEADKPPKPDRLTRFQLLPSTDSEKTDLKEKLNKRLSEVIRTQQRRRNDQHKRKSHLDEDLKRRTRIWNERTPTTTLRTNTILHDLNSVDHRTVIGESHRSPGNQTLPEIESDSEDEGNSTLASWARSPYLQEQLHLQQNWDPKSIFGPIPPLHIDQIFPNSKPSKLKQQPLTRKNL